MRQRPLSRGTADPRRPARYLSVGTKRYAWSNELLGPGWVGLTVFDADEKSVEEISEEIRALSQRVHERRIRPADLGEGTFTVSNLGMFGIEEFDAIVNEPQAAILAVGKVAPEPAVTDGTVVVRHRCRLSLTCDHRAGRRSGRRRRQR